MKSVAISDFKSMKAEDIKEGGSFALTADGEFVAFVIVPISADKKSQFEALASQMNIAIGKD